MICSFKTVTVNVAMNGIKQLCRVDREGIETTVLREEASEENHRKYYCTSCKQEFAGEEVEDWDRVVAHLGTVYTPPPKEWHEEVEDLEAMDLYDTRLEPKYRRPLAIFRQEQNE